MNRTEPPRGFFAELPGLRWRVPALTLALLAFLIGILVAGGALTYSPAGRINVVVLFFIWGALPFLGSLMAVVWALRGAPVPWLLVARRPGTLSNSTNWRAGSRIQGLWSLFALGMVAGYLLNLLFLDLAFAWSSTLLEDPRLIEALVRWVSMPWADLWPAARPGADIIALTRFDRVDPGSAAGAEARAWWPFLLMVLLIYNLAPRIILGAIFALLAGVVARRQPEPGIQISSADPATAPEAGAPEPRITAHWQQWAPQQAIYWGQSQPAGARDGLVLGQGRWQDELAQVRQKAPAWQSVAWVVDGHQAPVADLSDMIRAARTAGPEHHALCVLGVAPGSHYDKSWRSFAHDQELVWLLDGPQENA